MLAISLQIVLSNILVFQSYQQLVHVLQYDIALKLKALKGGGWLALEAMASHRLDHTAYWTEGHCGGADQTSVNKAIRDHRHSLGGCSEDGFQKLLVSKAGVGGAGED